MLVQRTWERETPPPIRKKQREDEAGKDDSPSYLRPQHDSPQDSPNEEQQTRASKESNRKSQKQLRENKKRDSARTLDSVTRLSAQVEDLTAKTDSLDTSVGELNERILNYFKCLHKSLQDEIAQLRVAFVAKSDRLSSSPSSNDPSPRGAPSASILIKPHWTFEGKPFGLEEEERSPRE